MSEKLKRGDVVGPYTVVKPRGFCGVLPIAVINLGHPNAGIQVILTHAERRP